MVVGAKGKTLLKLNRNRGHQQLQKTLRPSFPCGYILQCLLVPPKDHLNLKGMPADTNNGESAGCTKMHSYNNCASLRRQYSNLEMFKA